MQDTRNIIIGFNPYVSFLDTYDRYRYNSDDMVPLVSFLASKFRKNFVELDYFEYKSSIFFKLSLYHYVNLMFHAIIFGDSLKLLFNFVSDPSQSIYLSGFSVAKYNCLNTTKTKLKLYLIVITGDTCNCSAIQDISQNSTILANEINKVCNETVHTILLESRSIACPSLMTNCGEVLNLTGRHKWGEVIYVEDYCNATQL